MGNLTREKCTLKPSKMTRKEAVRLWMDKYGYTQKQAEGVICKDCYK